MCRNNSISMFSKVSMSNFIGIWNHILREELDTFRSEPHAFLAGQTCTHQQYWPAASGHLLFLYCLWPALSLGNALPTSTTNSHWASPPCKAIDKWAPAFLIWWCLLCPWETKDFQHGQRGMKGKRTGLGEAPQGLLEVT